ncbi:hypothetical protein ACSNOI_30320 [Actinomadura kijaniata]|uniref:hypothetical protein n=1 Tax=Actinomadura kijaniata TaxID=46161 RepID=UPI003F1AD408
MMTRPRLAALTAASVPAVGLAVALLAPSAAQPPPAGRSLAADRPREAGRQAVRPCHWAARTTTRLREAPRVTATPVRQLAEGEAHPCESAVPVRGGRYRDCGGAGDRWAAVYWGPPGGPADRVGYLAARCVSLRDG